MNKARMAQAAKALGLLQEAQAILDQIADEERTAYDNLSEGLQQSERGSLMSDNADALENARGNCQSAQDDLGNIEGLS